MNKSNAIIILLAILLVLAGGGAVKFYLDYQKTASNLLGLKKKFQEETARLTREKQRVEKEKQDLKEKIQRLQKDINAYRQEIDSLKIEKKTWEEKYNSVVQDRVSLKERIRELEEKIEEKVEEIGDLKVKLKELESQGSKRDSDVGVGISDDEFWADVVQKKAELEAKVQELESLIREKEVARKEALQKKLELEIKLSELELKNRELQRQLEYANRMISILSRDYVREKENRRIMKEMLEKIEKENDLIKNKVIRLTKSETHLEKELAESEKQKALLKKHLEDMDTVIRDSIEEIMTMREKVEKLGIKSSKIGKSAVVDLPPIVVGEEKGERVVSKRTEAIGGIKQNGKVLHVNEAHNFVVIDLGRNDGVVEGMEFDVMRGGEKVARVKVKMLKDDVCAADIVKFYGDNEIRVGDVVR